MPEYIAVNYGAGVILPGLGLILLTGVAFGLVPIFDARRADLRDILHEGARGSSGGRGAGRLRGLLIAAEIATAVVLTAGALLTLDGFQRLTATEPGFDAANLLTLKIDLPAQRYSDDETMKVLGRRLLEELKTLPGVEGAQLWAPDMPGQAGWYSTFIGEHKEIDSVAEAVLSRFHAVSPGALRALSMRQRSPRRCAR